MSKSASSLAYVILNKAAELDIDLPLLQCTLIYLSKNDKEIYSDEDLKTIISSTVDQLERGFKQFHPELDANTCRFKAHSHTKEALFQVVAKSRTGSVIRFIQENCQHELQAVRDFLLMAETGFDEKDMLTVLNSYH